MKILVVNDSNLLNRDIMNGDVCDVTEEMWYSNHPAALVTKPDGKEYWYQKSAFRLLEDIREEKLNKLGI